jgi:SAM-dependent methyltransferase
VIGVLNPLGWWKYLWLMLRGRLPRLAAVRGFTQMPASSSSPPITSQGSYIPLDRSRLPVDAYMLVKPVKGGGDSHPCRDRRANRCGRFDRREIPAKQSRADEDETCAANSERHRWPRIHRRSPQEPLRMLKQASLEGVKRHRETQITNVSRRPLNLVLIHHRAERSCDEERHQRKNPLQRRAHRDRRQRDPPIAPGRPDVGKGRAPGQHPRRERTEERPRVRSTGNRNTLSELGITRGLAHATDAVQPRTHPDAIEAVPQSMSALVRKPRQGRRTSNHHRPRPGRDIRLPRSSSMTHHRPQPTHRRRRIVTALEVASIPIGRRSRNGGGSLAGRPYPTVMDDPLGDIIAHYKEIDEGQRITSGLGELELLRTQEVITRHLAPTAKRILDVGGATGVHAGWLAMRGHDVHLVDLLPHHVEAARALTVTPGRVTAEIGDARRLSVADASFDAALVLGPLYHLLERDDRLRALSEARRAVRPGAFVFVAAISRFASLFDGLARGFLFDPAFRSIVVGDLRDGRHLNPEHRPHWFTTAYFHRPEELQQEVVDAGLEMIELVGVEGLAGWLRGLSDRWNEEGGRDAILFSARAIEREPSLLGLSAHLLAVARRAL